MKDQLATMSREVLRLKALNRLHKGDKDMKIAEMAVTIRTLSAKSDIHAQLSAVRQDILSEKLISHHLRTDLDSFRSMLEEEQIKVSQLRKELANLQTTIDCNDIYQSVVGVPGVDPHTLLSTFSGHINHITQELSSTKHSLEDAFTRLDLIQQSQRKSTVHFGNSEGLRGSKSQRSSSPVNKESDEFKGSDQTSPKIDRDFSLNFSPQSTLKDRIDLFQSSAVSVDKHATPKMLLDSLDVVLLNDKLKLQDSVIFDMNRRIEQLMEENLKLQKDNLQMTINVDASDKSELEYSNRKQILLQTELEETREELNRVRSLHVDVEKRMIEMKSMPIPSSRMNLIHEEVATNDTTSEEVYRELDQTKNLLKERTVQLKVLMETLESLQFAGVAPGESDEALDATNSLVNLAMNPFSIPNVEGSWSTQALVKRVIELTTELCSQSSVISLKEQNLVDYDVEVTRKIKENNRLKSELKSCQANIIELSNRCEAYRSQMVDTEKTYIDQLSALKQHNESLLAEFKACESENLKYALDIKELKRQLEIFVQEEVSRYIDNIQIDEEKILGSIVKLNFSGDKSSSTEDGAIRSLIVSLLKEWKDVSINNVIPSQSNSISKQKQQFLQKVADLVSRLSNRESTLNQKYIDLEYEWRRIEASKNITEEKLKAVTAEMITHKKRTAYYERIINSDYLSLLNKKCKVEIMLKKHLNEERERYYSLLNDVLSEKSFKNEVDNKKLSDSIIIKKLQSQLLEYESRGSYNLQYRDEAISSIDGKINKVEESMYKWFRVELPRLISGLPVTEENLASYNNDDLIGGSGWGLSSLGIEKSYALSQALCSYKAIQTTQEMKIAGLTERLAIYKEKCMELDGVIQSYRDELGSSILTQSLQLDSNVRRGSTADVESKFAEQNQSLSQQVLEFEEEIVEYKGKLEYMDIRYNEMKKFVDVLLSDENTIKTKATNQITRIRIDLENKHMDELKVMREMYEQEKIYLIDELEKVNNAVLEVNDQSEPKLTNYKKVVIKNDTFDDSSDVVNKSIDDVLLSVAADERDIRTLGGYNNIDRNIDNIKSEVITDSNSNSRDKLVTHSKGLDTSDLVMTIDSDTSLDISILFPDKQSTNPTNDDNPPSQPSSDANTQTTSDVLPRNIDKESGPPTGKTSITTNDNHTRIQSAVDNTVNTSSEQGNESSTSRSSSSSPHKGESISLPESDVNNLLRDVEADNLERELRIERRKNEEAVNEV